MTLKVLRFHLSDKYELDDFLMQVVPIEPTYFRNGFYKYGSREWIEWNGEAFIGDYMSFNDELNSITRNEHPPRQVEFTALQNLHDVNHKLLTGPLRDLYYTESFRRELRELHTSIIISMMKP